MLILTPIVPELDLTKYSLKTKIVRGKTKSANTEAAVEALDIYETGKYDVVIGQGFVKALIPDVIYIIGIDSEFDRKVKSIPDSKTMTSTLDNLEASLLAALDTLVPADSINEAQ